jgi:hypothetical protein
MVVEALARAQRQATVLRQQAAADRVAFLSDDWLEIAWRFVGQRYPDSEQVSRQIVRDQIRQRVNVTTNVFKRLCNTVCVAYNSEPARSLHEASKGQIEAWNRLLKETCVATKAKDWERYAWGCNVAIVLPIVRPDMNGGERRLDFDLILPHHADVVPDAANKREIIALTYSTIVGTGEHTHVEWVVVDRETMRHHDVNGKLLHTIAHNAGVFPGVDFRFAHPVDDWWNASLGEGIVDATLNVAHLGARLELVRDQQDRMREVITSKRQMPNGVWTGLLQLPDDPGDLKYELHNAIVDPQFHISQMRWHAHQAAESMNVPSILVDFDAGSEANANPLAAAQVHEALAGVRNEHIAWLTEDEGRLFYRASLVMRGMGHPLARELQPDLVHDAFRLMFPPLAFAEHPKAKLEIAEKEIEIGILSTARAYMRMNPQCKTIEEAQAAVEAVAVEEGKLNDFYVERNISRDPKQRRVNLAEAQGMMGGRPSNEEKQNGNASKPGRAAAPAE